MGFYSLNYPSSIAKGLSSHPSLGEKATIKSASKRFELSVTGWAGPAEK